MKFRISLLLGIIIFSAATANAQVMTQDSIFNVINAYRYFKEVDNLSINVPTVVEVPFADEFIERFDFAVLDKTTNSFEPHFFRQERFVNQIPISVRANSGLSVADYLVDNNVNTYAEFDLSENEQGRVQIVLTSVYPITSSALTTLLDNYVALPSSVEIRATISGIERIVLANRRMDQQTIRFPQTTSNRWVVTFIYGQPLRVTELRLIQENAAETSSRTLRFLAQPGHTYRIYFDPDRQAAPPVGEAGNLAISEGVLQIAYVSPRNNPNYTIADMDKDGVSDLRDNCVSVANSDQEDINSNCRGDTCDDFDQDSIMNNKDNCPNLPNRDQRDTDDDGLGDVCDKEESRVTERYPWVPWIGIGFAALVLIVLFALTFRSSRSKTTQNHQ